MKSYTVNITEEVETEIRGAFHYINERSPQNAVSWLRGLYAAIDTLETMPERCSLIPENLELDLELRHLLYHSHRIIFAINEAHSLVEVFAFRHAAQDEFG